MSRGRGFDEACSISAIPALGAKNATSPSPSVIVNVSFKFIYLNLILCRSIHAFKLKETLKHKANVGPQFSKTKELNYEVGEYCLEMFCRFIVNILWTIGRVVYLSICSET